MTKWEDESSYSKGQKDRIPTNWAVKISGELVNVHRLHYSPDRWYLSCWFTEHRELKSTDAESAKKEALGEILKWLTVATADCDKFLEAAS